MKSFRIIPVTLILAIFISCNNEKSAYELPEVDHKDLSNLHGFNLLEKFSSGWFCGPFEEKDFKVMANYGFNFARLPMDYRCLTAPGAWDILLEEPMKDIDEAVAFGKKYGIHVCINLHHAPGYCINARDLYSADSSLWTGTIAQDAFVSLWRQMAERYKGISNDNVSFNLLNEPVGTSKQQYLDVAIRAIEAIREVDSDRLIMSDGWNVGRDPIPELVPYDVVQMFRGYWPMNLSHCGANWVNNEYGPEAEWPSNQYLSQFINAGEKPFTLKHEFDNDTRVDIKLLRASGQTEMVVKADDKELLSEKLDPANDEVVNRELDKASGIHTSAYMKSFTVTVPTGTKKFTIEAEGGEWITFGEVAVYTNGEATDPVKIIPGNIWGSEQIPVLIRDGGFVSENDPDVDWEQVYIEEQLEPWLKFKEENNIGIMVGEWGVYERAPRQATIDWMKFMLESWNEANLGWAVWNFRGTFGFADNDRPDTEYTEMEGMMVDVEMLELLKGYANQGEGK